MRIGEPDVTGVAVWLVAVFGAGMVLVGPITPWLVPVELVGVTACAIATATLVLLSARR